MLRHCLLSDVDLDGDFAHRARTRAAYWGWEEGRALGLEVAESDWPIRFLRWVTKVEPRGSGARITQSLEYQVKFGALGWLLDRLVMKRKLTASLDQVFAELAKHAEASPAAERG